MFSSRKRKLCKFGRLLWSESGPSGPRKEEKRVSLFSMDRPEFAEFAGKMAENQWQHCSSFIIHVVLSDYFVNSSSLRNMRANTAVAAMSATFRQGSLSAGAWTPTLSLLLWVRHFYCYSFHQPSGLPPLCTDSECKISWCTSVVSLVMVRETGVMSICVT